MALPHDIRYQWADPDQPQIGLVWMRVDPEGRFVSFLRGPQVLEAYPHALGDIITAHVSGLTALTGMTKQQLLAGMLGGRPDDPNWQHWSSLAARTARSIVQSCTELKWLVDAVPGLPAEVTAVAHETILEALDMAGAITLTDWLNELSFPNPSPQRPA